MTQPNEFLKRSLLLLACVAACAACHGNIPLKVPTSTSMETPISALTLTSSPTPLPTYPPTATVTETPTPISTSMDGWLTYRNAGLRFELRYPPEAILSTKGVMGYSLEELPPGMTDDEFLASLVQKYPGDLCVGIEVRMGFITIQAPPDKGGKYTGPCGVTGIGAYDIIAKTETVLVDRRTYVVKILEVHQRDAAGTFQSEFSSLQLEDGTQIDFGGHWLYSGDTYADYLPVKKILLQILESYSSY